MNNSTIKLAHCAIDRIQALHLRPNAALATSGIAMLVRDVSNAIHAGHRIIMQVHPDNVDDVSAMIVGHLAGLSCDDIMSGRLHESDFSKLTDALVLLRDANLTLTIR